MYTNHDDRHPLCPACGLPTCRPTGPLGRSSRARISMSRVLPPRGPHGLAALRTCCLNSLSHPFPSTQLLTESFHQGPEGRAVTVVLNIQMHQQ